MLRARSLLHLGHRAICVQFATSGASLGICDKGNFNSKRSLFRNQGISVVSLYDSDMGPTPQNWPLGKRGKPHKAESLEN